jgi:hypothetical protein
MIFPRTATPGGIAAAMREQARRMEEDWERRTGRKVKRR